ncbi:MAG TPA: hypothetical protein VEX68_00910 [Bryobacteraceae bacterium]|nr:hypothetical protein [Bryobacteraceae bacterium]
MSSEEIRSAVKSLRLSIKNEEGDSISQTEFGRLIDKSLNTVQRYESLMPPRGAVLMRLAQLARARDREDLATIFFRALEDQLGVSRYFLEKEVMTESMGNVARLIRGQPPPTTREEKLSHDILLFIAELSKLTNSVSAHIGEATLILEKLETLQLDKAGLLEGVRDARKHLVTAHKQLDQSLKVDSLLDSFREYTINERHNNKTPTKKRKP